MSKQEEEWKAEELHLLAVAPLCLTITRDELAYKESSFPRQYSKN